MSASQIMQQFGVLPWRKDRQGALRLLLITSRGRGRWIVPKGWPMKDRAPYLAAALEAFEEAGVVGEVMPNQLGSYQATTMDEHGGILNRRVTLFSLKVVGTLTNWPEREQRKRQWFGLEEAADRVDDAGLGDIIREMADDPHLLTGGSSRRMAGQFHAASLAGSAG
jgi:8-oxo-dGTP pyrophosphatase MutT (NUDIX family)